MNTPENLKYTKTDEWFDPTSGKVGITDYAQSQLSDIVFLEILAIVGESLSTGTAVASVESVKAAGEVYLPVAGKVTTINGDLIQKPETLNTDPYTEGWMLQVEASDVPADLMDAAAYIAYCASREH
jgi:glycine cleavage system H protein